jgi:hypothetical protein
MAPITRIFALTEKIEKVYPQKNTAAETRSTKSGCGGPKLLGRIPDYFINVVINQDRALSSPSPSANLAGIWKGYDSDDKPPVFCRRFFISHALNRPFALRHKSCIFNQRTRMEDAC